MLALLAELDPWLPRQPDLGARRFDHSCMIAAATTTRAGHSPLAGARHFPLAKRALTVWRIATSKSSLLKGLFSMR